ncbi:MAG: hypothetical protein KDD66_01845 [Bdellovibrionales bacterium]|nr:hypothetical protein [Bdellovibrionales bacterium]
MHRKFNALIIDPDLESRARLKTAAHHEQQSGAQSFGAVFAVNSLRDGLVFLQNGRKADVVFLSHRLDHEEMVEFIDGAKKTTVGEDCAYIRVLKPSDKKAEKVAEQLLEGADGMLYEPFCVADLTIIVKIAAEVKRQNAIRRLSAATALLLGNAIEAIDYRAAALSVGAEHMPYPTELKHAFRMFKDMPKEEEAAFYDVVVERFISIKTPPPKPKINYAGASKRVKTTLTEKLKEELVGD